MNIHYGSDITKLDQQWRQLRLVKWPKTKAKDAEQFWTDVNHEDAAGEKDFYEVGQFALAMLALPFSNSAVERVFSQMNIIKTKRRNCMKQLMVASFTFRFVHTWSGTRFVVTSSK